jgi:hypothetical protein
MAVAVFGIIYGAADLGASGGWSYLVTVISSFFLLAVVIIVL